MNNLLENLNLKELTSQFSRNPNQINGLLESDAELIKLENSDILAITTDSIIEEIEYGLYTDPYQIGWILVTANLSDLAAVGAEPIGIVIQQNLPEGYGKEDLVKLQRGINEACKFYQTFILGGDTSNGKEFMVGATAIGKIKGSSYITRKGACPGDQIFISGPMGSGNAFAFSQLLLETKNSSSFLPKAQLQEGQLIRKFGSSCIDSSDGLFPALCNLMEINKVGLEVTKGPDEILGQENIGLANQFEIPGWFLLAGPHGEYELVFTIPPENVKSFLNASEILNWTPLNVGVMLEERESYLNMTGKLESFNLFKVANLFTECKGHPQTYLKELFKIHNR